MGDKVDKVKMGRVHSSVLRMVLNVEQLMFSSDIKRHQEKYKLRLTINLKDNVRSIKFLGD